jgi:hypothetical protein
VQDRRIVFQTKMSIFFCPRNIIPADYFLNNTTFGIPFPKQNHSPAPDAESYITKESVMTNKRQTVIFEQVHSQRCNKRQLNKTHLAKNLI